MPLFSFLHFRRRAPIRFRTCPIRSFFFLDFDVISVRFPSDDTFDRFWIAVSDVVCAFHSVQLLRSCRHCFYRIVLHLSGRSCVSNMAYVFMFFLPFLVSCIAFSFLPHLACFTIRWLHTNIRNFLRMYADYSCNAECRTKCALSPHLRIPTALWRLRSSFFTLLLHFLFTVFLFHRVFH